MTILISFWILILLVIAILLLSFAIYNLKRMIDRYNSQGGVYKDRFKLRTSATSMHLLLLLVMFILGILQLSVVLSSENKNNLSFRLGTIEIIMSALINCIICFVCWTLTKKQVSVYRPRGQSSNSFSDQKDSFISVEQSGRSFEAILNSD